MRLFGYYACHTFVNQLKKLFKTWVLVFIAICMVFGIIIGAGASIIGGMSDDTDVTEETIYEEDSLQEDAAEEELPLEEPEKADVSGIVELAAGGVILAVFLLCALGADKNGSKIFLPADVNILFASPLKPQSVLMFRLATQLGTSILASVYLLFQLPNLTLNLGLDVWAALAFIAVWCLTIMVGKMLQMLLYTVCSTHITWKKHLRNGIYGVLVLVAVGYFAYLKTSGLGYLDAALGFFNSPVSRYIPFWGWLKAICVYAMEGNLVGVLVSAGAVIAGGLVLGYIIWHVKADFYEDAMAKSQETAALLEKAQSDKNVIVKRKKDRSDKLKREGLNRGRGANVFFAKSLYNRFRFAHLGIFTKTSETYLVAAVGVAALCRFVFYIPGLLPVALTLAALTFFRALGNPLEEDTRMDYFVLIPESTWKKLFWSLMGGTVNCFLDLLPGMVLAVILLGENPLVAMAWIPLIVSVDFFSTTVGTFISLSVPVSAGKMVKQLVQILFIYFGLLPDIGIMAVGIVLGHPAIAAIVATAVNAGLGFVFLGLTPMFLEPKDGKKYRASGEFNGNFKQIGKHFSLMGLSAFIILVLGSVLQILLAALCPQWLRTSWGMWLCTFGPIYLIAVPVGLLILKAVPCRSIEKQSMKPGRYLIILLISFFMMYAGNLVGGIVTGILQAVLGNSPANPIMNFATGQSVLPKILFLVILAPIIEEFIFRKQLMDRMHVYGQKTAIFTSALMFGLFHGNLSQLFYAFALGLVFGYVYLKTGKLRYSISLHMIINFLGGVVGPMFLEHLDLSMLNHPETLDLSALMPMLPWLAGFALYMLVLVGLSIAGLVLLCVKCRQIRFAPEALQLPKGTVLKTVYGNLGMILLIAACLGLIVTTLL